MRPADAMSERRYRYQPGVLSALERFGIVPAPATPPKRVYALLKAIYTFEIREMKFRRRELERALGPQPLDDYRRGLHRLKEKYAVLKIPAPLWAERE